MKKQVATLFQKYITQLQKLAITKYSQYSQLSYIIVHRIKNNL
jgi:hypothetical protein